MEVPGLKVVGVSGASSKRPKAPAFVWMTPQESSWSSLQSIIPNILHLGVIGYPFVNPGPIGGSPAVGNQTEPSMELFIRWWQLATFLPQAQADKFDVDDIWGWVDSQIEDNKEIQSAVNSAKDYAKEHGITSLNGDEIKDAAKDAAEDGLDLLSSLLDKYTKN